MIIIIIIIITIIIIIIIIIKIIIIITTIIIAIMMIMILLVNDKTEKIYINLKLKFKLLFKPPPNKMFLMLQGDIAQILRRFRKILNVFGGLLILDKARILEFIKDACTFSVIFDHPSSHFHTCPHLAVLVPPVYADINFGYDAEFFRKNPTPNIHFHHLFPYTNTNNVIHKVKYLLTSLIQEENRERKIILSI